MSVCDDSKVKLIETKDQILYSLFKQIKDKEFEKLLSLSELKYNNPIVYQLLEKYDENETKCNPNVEEVHKQMTQILKNKCIDILQMITGEDVDENDEQIAHKLKLALNKMSSELNETKLLTNKFNINYQTYQKIFCDYLQIVIKYYKKYKITFKPIYEEMLSNLKMCKAETLCIKTRLDETDRVLQKYGKKETIEELKVERKSLEIEEFELKSELKKGQSLLSQYDSLDPELIKEYKSLKSDLETKRWAIHELNQSSGSQSNGSIYSE